MLFAFAGDEVGRSEGVGIFHDAGHVDALPLPELEEALAELVVPQACQIPHPAARAAGGNREI